MNNLLRTLTESQVKSGFPDSDLKLLLTTVKEGRRQSYDAKLSDPFYDSLEGLLQDLRTITIDNRDAEAFLKPVSKAEVLDYYDFITNPMDLQTMLKKVKQKQYKSKREFKDDLDLIWSNCYTYNATENHPLRQCAKRLKGKADRLLKNITDRKERADPPIPPDLASTPPPNSRPKINGYGLINGHSHRSPSSPPVSKSSTASTKASQLSKNLPRRDAPFPDTLAIIRTPSGMSTFSQLDREIGENPSFPKPVQANGTTLSERLREFIPPIEYDSESEGIQSPEESSMIVDDVVGDKRKLNGIVDHRPRKRARLNSQFPGTSTAEKDDISHLWWGAVQSDALLGNGLPGLPFSSSASLSSRSKRTKAPKKANPNLRPKRRKKALRADPPKSLLTVMNNNIRTMKRVRHTHAKFAALNLNSLNNEEADGGLSDIPGGGGFGVGGVGGEEEGVGVDDDRVDERPWSLEGKGKVKGVEIGEDNAADCVRWMGGKVLEHAGFQGTSKVALDVLAGVTSDYLLNVGRTIRYLCDKYSNSMTAEEIILHTLFESGTSKIQDLERYISDDIVRYGSRLGDLEKKLVGAYREATAVEVLDDEGLFDEEDNEEDGGVFAIGNFADALGEDFLGLRELGIAAEFGMTSLSIPKRLLKGKKGDTKLLPAAVKPTEPPPPFPPPPPFIPLNSAKVDDQIELLKPYYHSRLLAITSTALPQPMTLPGPFGFNLNQAAPPPPGPGAPHLDPTANGELKLPVVVIPDDLPNPMQMKMGPLGQIVKGGPSGGAKKKAKAAGVGLKTDGGGDFGTGAAVEVAPPKKKKGMVGVGSGNGRKKKLGDAQQQPALPPVVVASA